MSEREISAGGIARGMKKWFGFFAERALTWPKLSRMPSWARMWLATIRSSMRASSGSGVCARDGAAVSAAKRSMANRSGARCMEARTLAGYRRKEDVETRLRGHDEASE